ncbi:hypothetical protein ACJJTC_019518 [Scirpophaga incertulas]
MYQSRLKLKYMVVRVVVRLSGRRGVDRTRSHYVAVARWKSVSLGTPWCKWSWWTVVSRCSCLSFGSRLIHEGVYKQDGRVGNGTPVRVDRAVGNGTPVRLDRAVGNGTPVRVDRARRSLRRSGRL